MPQFWRLSLAPALNARLSLNNAFKNDAYASLWKMVEGKITVYLTVTKFSITRLDN
jgi:hypothetical protein